MTIYAKFFPGNISPTYLKRCDRCGCEINSFTNDPFSFPSRIDDICELIENTTHFCNRCGEKMDREMRANLLVDHPPIRERINIDMYPPNESQMDVSRKYAAEWLTFRGWTMHKHKDREEWNHHHWGPLTFEQAVMTQAGREGYYHKKDGTDSRAESSKFNSEIAGLIIDNNKNNSTED